MSLCHADASSTGWTIRVLPGRRSLPLPPSDRSLCPKTGRGVCKATPEIGWVGIISSFFQAPLTLPSLLVSPYSVPSFSSGLFIPSHHFKRHSAFTVVIPIPPVIPIFPSSSGAPLFPRRHDVSRLKIRRSLLKERIKHLFPLMASTMVTEELSEISEVPLTPLTVQDGGTPPRDGGLETGHPAASAWTSHRACKKG